MADFYVDGDNGNDANDGSTEALAKATIQAAVTAAADNDRVLIQNNGSTVYNEVVTWSDKGVRLEGYGSTVGDQTKAVLDGTTGSLANAFSFTNTTGIYSIRFLNFEIRNYTADGIDLNRTGGGNNSVLLFENLHIHDCGGHGISIDTSFANSRSILVTRVRINHCADGISANNHRIMMALSTIVDNSGLAVNLDNDSGLLSAAYSIFARNASNVLAQAMFANCVLDSPDGNDNWITPLGALNVAVATGFTNAPAGGFGIDPDDFSEWLALFNCGFFSNAAGDIDGTADIDVGSITGSDPGYQDAANDDYTITGTSPWYQQQLEIGVPGDVMSTFPSTGPSQPQASGGGLLMGNLRGNKQ